MHEAHRRETSFGSKPATETTYHDVDAKTDLDELRRQAARHVLGKDLTPDELSLLAQQRAGRSQGNNHVEQIPGLRYHPISEAPRVFERFDSPANRAAFLTFDPGSSRSEARLFLIQPRTQTS